MDKQIEEMASYLIGKVVTGADSTKVLDLGYITVKEISSILVNAGYRKESDTVKEVLEKVLSFAAEDEVGMKYLIRKLAREYGVELSGKLIKMRAI